MLVDEFVEDDSAADALLEGGTFVMVIPLPVPSAQVAATLAVALVVSDTSAQAIGSPGTSSGSCAWLGDGDVQLRLGKPLRAHLPGVAVRPHGG
jgi:hypothetical protein